MKRWWIGFIVLSVVAAGSVYKASADNEKISPIVEETIFPEISTVGCDVYTRYMPYSEVDAMSGKVGISESGGALNYEYKVMGLLPVNIAVTADYINIDKTVPIPLPVSLSSLGLDLETRVPFFSVPNTYVGVGINPSFNNDRFSFTADSFLFPTRLFGAYMPAKNLIIAGGVEFFTNFYNEVQPIGGIIYKPTERLTINLLSDNPNITYQATKAFSVFAEGNYSLYNQYRVRRYGDENVLIEYKYMYAGGGLSYVPAKNIRAKMSVGGAFDRAIKAPDAGGKVVIDGGLYLQGRIEIAI